MMATSISIITISLLSLAFVASVAHWSTPANETSPVARVTVFAPHNPIVFAGNAGFIGSVETTGVTGGSGTSSDPYLIEGWEITGPAIFGISIYGADVHFVIQDCYVHDLISSPSNPPMGIALQICPNCTIRDCIISNVWIGILFADSSGALLNNTCSLSTQGISLLGASNNTCLVNNTCTSNLREGISLATVTNITLANNNCSSDGQCGIRLESSYRNRLIENTCFDNVEGINLSASSSDNDLSGNNCTYNYHGMSFESSNNNALEGNNCSYNSAFGIRFLDSSNNNNISDNVFLLNGQFGLGGFENCSGNRIWNNTLRYNNGSGDSYDPLRTQACDAGASNWWNSTDGYGNYWSDWTEPDADMNGIVDLAYAIAGSSGASDYYPRTTAQTQIPEFGLMPLMVIVFLVTVFLMAGARRRKAS